MYNELIKALRKHADWINACESTSAYTPKCVSDWAKDMRDAADAIERLRTELTRIKGEHDDNRQD